MKKVMLAVLTLAMLGTSAYAAPTVEIVKNDDGKRALSNKIEVTESFGETNNNKDATLLVVKKGTDLTAIGAEDTELTDVIDVVSGTTDDKGNVTFTFYISDERYDDATGYDVYTKLEGSAFLDKNKATNLLYAKMEARGELDYSNESNWASNVLTDTNEVLLETAGCNYKTYKAMTTANQVKVRTYAGDEEVFPATSPTPDDFVNAINKGVATVAMGGCTTSAGAKTILTELNPTSSGEEYKELTENEKSFLANSMLNSKGTGYESVAAFDAMYEKANILMEINDSTKVSAYNMETTLKSYASTLGITSSEDYIAYTNLTNKDTANGNIEAALKTTKAYTVDGLLSTIKTAMATTSDDNKGGGGGGGGGAPSGSPSEPSGTSDPTTGSSVGVPSVLPSETHFNDLGGVAWAQTAIEAMYTEGVVAGDGNGNFRPNDTVKREEFVRMLVMALGVLDDTAECDFGDVAKGEWYYSSIATANKLGLANGMSEDGFGIGVNITRQDFMVMCYRAVKNSGKLTKVREYDSFADEASIADYAKEAVQALYTAGVVNGMGDGVFSPTATATRAQAALVIYNLFVK